MLRYGFDGIGVIHWIFIIGVVVFWGLVVAALILGVRWLIRANTGGNPPPPAPGPRPDDPLEILRQRYARGEIDEEEYERRRKTLSGA